MIYCVVPEALADELFDKLVDYYKDDPNVEVILDRREGARVAPRPATPAERRRADRRQMEQSHLLRTLGVVLVSRDERGKPKRERRTRRPRG